MKWDWSSLNDAQMNVYRDLCPDYEYRVFKYDFELPGVSKGLADKCPLVMIAASGDATGRVFYMANLYRSDADDPKGKAVDQMPFGFVFDTASPLRSGVLIQHGDWDGRTIYPPASAWDDIVNGDYQAYADLTVVPNCTAGSIYDLNVASPQSAFATLIDKLSSKVSEQAKIESADDDLPTV